MATPENILQKVKFLINLSNSPNSNEAANAKAMVDKLIAKHGITDAELKSLEDKEAQWGDDDKLFSTIGIVGWKQKLALTISNFFYCRIIQEHIAPDSGLPQYNYFVYGDPEDVQMVMFVYNAFNTRIEELVDTRCIGRGPIYIGSYTEGLVEAINNTIEWDGIDIPDLKIPSRKIETEAPVLNNGASNLDVYKAVKDKPVEESVAPEGRSIIKDLQAYFRGLDDGKNFSFKDVLELAVENEKFKALNREKESSNEGDPSTAESETNTNS